MSTFGPSRELGVRIVAVVDKASFAQAAAEVARFTSQQVGTKGITAPLGRPDIAAIRQNARVEAEARLQAYESAMKGITTPVEAKGLLKELNALQREVLKIKAPDLVPGIQRAKVEVQDLITTLKQIPRATTRGAVGEAFKLSPEQKAQFETSAREIVGRASEAFKTLTRSADFTPHIQQLKSLQSIASRIGLPELVRDSRVVLGVGEQTVRGIRMMENASANAARAIREQEKAALGVQRAGVTQVVAERQMQTEFAKRASATQQLGVTQVAAERQMQAEFAKREVAAQRMGALETRAAREMQADFAARKARETAAFAARETAAKKFWTVNLAGTEVNIARMATWAVGFTVIYRAINQVTAAIGTLTLGGIARFAAFQQQVFRLAAELVNLDPGRPFKDAVREAEQVLTAMTKLRAAFIGTDVQLQELVVTATRFGVIRDLTDQTLAKLVIFGNLILNIGAQGARTNQIFGETQSIMERTAQTGDQVLRTIKSLDPEWKKNLENAAATGKTLDYILSLFPGYQEQVKFVNELLTAQSARLQSVLDRILRIAAAPMAKEILAGMVAVTGFLERFERQAAATAAAIGKAIIGGIAAAVFLVAPKVFRALGAFAGANFIGGFKGIGMGALFFGLAALAHQAGLAGGAAYAAAFIAAIGTRAIGVALVAALAKTNWALVGAFIGRAIIAGIAAAITSPAAIALAIGAAVGIAAGTIIRSWQTVGDAADNAAERQHLAIALNLEKFKNAAAEYGRSIEGLQAKFQLGDIAARTFIEGLAAEQQRITERMWEIQEALAKPKMTPAGVSALIEEYKKLQPELDKVRNLIRDAEKEQDRLAKQRFDDYIAQIKRVQDALADLGFRRLRAEGKDLEADLAELTFKATQAIEEFSKVGQESTAVVGRIQKTLLAEQSARIREATQEIWERYRDAYEKVITAVERARDAQIDAARAATEAITRPLEIRMEALELPEFFDERDLERYFQKKRALQQQDHQARMRDNLEAQAAERRFRQRPEIIGNVEAVNSSRRREIAILKEREGLVYKNAKAIQEMTEQEIRNRREGIMKDADRVLEFLRLRQKLLGIRVELGIERPEDVGLGAKLAVEEARLEAFRETLARALTPEQAAKLLREYEATLKRIVQMYPGAAQNPLFDPATAKVIAGLRGTIEALRQLAETPLKENILAKEVTKIKTLLDEIAALTAKIAASVQALAQPFIDEFNRIGTYIYSQFLPWLIRAFGQAGGAAGTAFGDEFQKALRSLPGPQTSPTGPPQRGQSPQLTPAATATSTSIINISLGSVNLNDVLTAQTKRDLIRELLGAAGIRHQAYLNATGAGVPA